ncbi:MAG: RnfABCDGE type electron transport complex subunit D, partial [Planctomycetes bacterium]|nr:RnfABCDGE type electron transport complex subunit D [Planctomycetota bacterium]
MSREPDVLHLSIAPSPHIREGENTARIMWTVACTLAPILLFALVNFGWYAGVVTLTSVGSCVVFEALWQKFSGRPITAGDGSAVVTGMLLAFVLPPNVPLFVAVVGAGVAIIVAKQLFGGLGCNIWNPALVGRAFVQIAYPQYVTLSSWPVVSGRGFTRVFQDIRNVAAAGADSAACDVISRATPLANDAVSSIAPSAAGHVHMMYPSLKALFLGHIPGCIGETSAILILAGGLFLIYKGYVNWKVPAVFL